jgi:hypothetical protein
MTPVWKCPSRQVCLVSASPSTSHVVGSLAPIILAFSTWRLAKREDGGWCKNVGDGLLAALFRCLLS